MITPPFVLVLAFVLALMGAYKMYHLVASKQFSQREIRLLFFLGFQVVFWFGLTVYIQQSRTAFLH